MALDFIIEFCYFKLNEETFHFSYPPYFCIYLSFWYEHNNDNAQGRKNVQLSFYD